MRLFADATFAQTVEKLRQMPQRRDRSLDALIRRLEGHLIYLAAYLDRVGHGDRCPPYRSISWSLSVHPSSYLSWLSRDGPDPTFIGRVVRARPLGPWRGCHSLQGLPR